MARGRKPGTKYPDKQPASPTSTFEPTLWAAADKLRGNMDAAEYKHVALGLIFLKYISDRFEERRTQAVADPEEAALVDERDLYISDNVFWLIFNTRNRQAIDYKRKLALKKRLGTTFSLIDGAGSGVGELSHSRRQGEACGA